MATLVAKAIVAGMELIALLILGIAFLILPDEANRFLSLLAGPLVVLFVFTLFDALLR